MRPLWLVLVGVGVGVLAVLGVAALVWDRSDQDASPGAVVELSFPGVDHDPRAAEELIGAWNRWRTATFVSSGVWSRALDSSDAPLEGDVYTAQDPPRRLVVRLGAVVEQVDGTIVSCDGAVEDLIVPECTTAEGQIGYDERVDAEMNLVRRYVIGDGRLYDVAEIAGCFHVEILAAAPQSPWGRAAEFCFDDESGALASSRVRRQSATDVETTSVIRTEVTDADF